MAEPQALEGLRQELRRGSLVLGVLAALRTERYGYTLRDTLSENGIEIEEGPLYPMLRRLEAQGLLTSEWREEGKRNKRFYRLSREGEPILERLLGELQSINESLSRIQSGESSRGAFETSSDAVEHFQGEPQQ